MNPTQIREEIDALLKEDALILRRIELLDQLLATYGDGSEPSARDEATPGRPVDPAEDPKKSKVEAECPECNRTFSSNIGLGIHRKKAHGIQSPTTKRKKKPRLAAVEPEPDPEPVEEAPTDSETVQTYFACTSCGAKASSREGLARHTDSAHRRGLTGVEHQAFSA